MLLAGLLLVAPALAAESAGTPGLVSAVPQLGAAGRSEVVGKVSVDPALSVAGQTAVASSSLAPASVDLSSPGSFALGEGASRFAFQAVGSDASAASTRVGSSALVFTDAWTDVDFAVRPSALGLQTFELLRSSAAPRSFSWTVSLPNGQGLRQLDDQQVAVVVRNQPPVPPANISPDANGLAERLPSPAPPPDLAESRLAPLSSAAPERSPDANALIGDAGLQVSRGIWALNDANIRAGSQVTALIQAPWARDAAGHPVSTSLSVKGSVITARVAPATNAVFPLVATQRWLTADAATAATSAALAANAPDPQTALRSTLPSPPAAQQAAGYFQFNGFTGLADSYCKESAGIVAPPDHPDLATAMNACPAGSVSSLLANNFWGIKVLRAVVSWNFLNNLKEKARFDAWYSWAKTVPGHYIMVAFQGESPSPPSFEAYVTGVQGLLMYGSGPSNDPDGYAAVAAVTPWNEPNEPRDDGTVRIESPDPWLAVRYLAADAYICSITRRCTVLAGDFSGHPGQRYISDYVGALWGDYPALVPDRWAFHAWTDVNRYLESGSRAAPATHYVRDTVNQMYSFRGYPEPSFWNTETGSFYKMKCQEGAFVLSWCGTSNGPGTTRTFRGSPEYFLGMWAQARGAAFALQLANVDPSHIQALLYYRYQAASAFDDPGLVGAIPSDGYGPDLFFSGPGQRRPSFCVVRDRITVDDPRLPPPVGC